MTVISLPRTFLACSSCGHDQAEHAPHNRPPYTCAVAGCTCSRTPDVLIVEVPDAPAPSIATAPADVDDCTLCGGYGLITTRRNSKGEWEERRCTRCGGSGNELGRTAPSLGGAA